MKLWSEAVNYSGFMENAILKVDQNEPSMKAWTGNIVRDWFNRLVQCGGIEYVTKKDNIKDNMKEQGFPEIMFGYAANSAIGMYQM